jgi:signal transduction histidine kinase
MLLLVGLVFAIAYGSQRITSDATALHKTDEILRSSTVVRAQLALGAQAGVVDRRFGASSSEAIAVSLGEARTAIDDIGTGMDALMEDDVEVTQLEEKAGNFVASANETIDLMERGEYEDAQQIVTRDLSATFEDLVDNLVELRDGLAASVASSDILLGHIGNVARFLVAFLLPAAVIFIYRDLLRRQARQTELEGRLETERQISAAREEFIANASHELRTPLTSITGLALLLEEDPVIKNDDASAELLDLMISESGDLNRMVEDLLTTARLDAGALSYTFQNVKPGTEIEEVVESIRRAGHAITIDLEPALVRADPIRLRQIIRNLLSNAAKYGGANVRVVGSTEGRTYVVEVIDDGEGVPFGISDRLFERFVHQGNTTAVRGSVGLGLSIVHALAQGMGGSVSYRRVNGDTHFAVRMPLSGAHPDDLEPTADAVGSGFDRLAG